MKKIALVLALALCAVILSGCAEINSLVSTLTGYPSRIKLNPGFFEYLLCYSHSK